MLAGSGRFERPANRLRVYPLGLTRVRAHIVVGMRGFEPRLTRPRRAVLNQVALHPQQDTTMSFPVWLLDAGFL